MGLAAAVSLGAQTAIGDEVQNDLHVSVRLGVSDSDQTMFEAVVADTAAFDLASEGSDVAPDSGRLAVGNLGNVGVFLEPSLSATRSGARRLAHVAASGPVQAITDAELGFTGSVSLGVSF